MALLTRTKLKKNLAMTALFNKLAIHDTQDISDSAPASLESSELEEEEEEEVEERGQSLQIREDIKLSNEYTHTCDSSPSSTSPYSLTSGPLIGGRTRRISGLSIASTNCSGRSRHQHFNLDADSSNSLTSDSSAPTSLIWEEQIHPSDHMKTLLYQLGSSISASKAAFALTRASATPCACAENTYIRAGKAMEEELQTLSHLQMSLYSLFQQHEFGKEQESPCETSTSESMGPNLVRNVERQHAMLKSYEGIINRFHDEMRRKDAVTEALKETLAKSMLKGEKLERRMKVIEAKLSPLHLK
ncbi:hypothetical protein GOP47_0026067 [Adiantum capillus-veneris]|uniref:DUF641 domain-containing protein n=1 Tax=Adiantum capillus-veneris TaxID=13818 RepID=A0A9D4U2D5_ADICA|nr:hypothetical protein GOP47_0026067 [Adiantum capillus-veneris]